MRPPHNNRPQFATTVPILGQQQAQARAGVETAVQQMAMSIYVRAAADYLADDPTPAGDAMEELARDSLSAAKSYFVGLGIATFPESTTTD